MNLTKARAKKPLLENAPGNASVRFVDGEWRYIIECHGPWTQGKGHESSYMLQLTKLEMLQAVTAWLESIQRDEQAAAKKAQTTGQ